VKIGKFTTGRVAIGIFVERENERDRREEGDRRKGREYTK